jgi:glycosyl transferase family 1
MRFNLITNHSNGVGLMQDANMLAAELESRGHEVQRIQFDRPQGYTADVNVSLEVVVESLFRQAPVNWLVPNPEWHYQHWPLGPFRFVLAKTHDAKRIFAAKVNGRCRYVGWRARDLYRPEVKRERRFLHVAGKSQFKNTEAVIEGCRLAGVELELISEKHSRRVSDEELTYAINRCQFFICPSQYEGFGMALHEALGCGAVVITMDAPPMNEIVPSLLIKPESSRPHNFGVLHTVAANAVKEAVETAMEYTDTEVSEWSELSRAAFENEVGQFSQALDAVLAEA